MGYELGNSFFKMGTYIWRSRGPDKLTPLVTRTLAAHRETGASNLGIIDIEYAPISVFIGRDSATWTGGGGGTYIMCWL